MAGVNRFDERLAFDAPVFSPNGMGGTLMGWAVQHECWGGITYLRGSEPVIAQRLQGVQPVVIRIRNCAAARRIGNDWRARDLHTNRIFALKGVWVLSHNRAFLDFMATSGVTP